MEFIPTKLKETLTGFILPFVNADPDEAVEIFVNKVGAASELLPWEKEFVKDGSLICHNEKSYLRTQSRPIVDLQNLIKDMLLIALLGRQNKPIPQEIESRIPRIEKRINNAIARSSIRVRWRGSAGNFVVSFFASKPRDSLNAAPSGIIEGVFNAFIAVPGTENEPEILGPGYDHIGMCPNCGIFFAKGRTDQLYCSKRCKGTDLKRLERQRKKLSTNN